MTNIELIKNIKLNIPPSIKKRQKKLYIKMQNNSLNLQERDELIALNGIIENKTADKIMLMGEFAKLRGITLEELNQQLYPNIYA